MKKSNTALLTAFALIAFLSSPAVARASPDDPDSNPAPGDDVTEIDLLVVYTGQARIETPNIGALIRHAVDQTNQVFANSLIRARVRLVHTYQARYTQRATLSEELNHLQTSGDGFMDEVHAVRDQYGADMVVLVRGRHRRNCSWGYGFWTYSHDRYAFGVIAQNCIGNYVLATRIGRLLGAGRDPTTSGRTDFPYGHALCNDRGNWRTLMSWNPESRCPTVQPYFSNPDVSFAGTPTGDAHTRNNARVINENAPIVAGYRDRPFPPRTVPLVISANNPNLRGFVRIINRSSRAGKVDILAIDDEGRRFGPAELSLDAKEAVHFDSNDLEDGNFAKGLSAGVGDGTGNWRLELESTLSIEHLAYVQTSDGGFLTSVNAVAELTDDGTMRHYVPMFNEARNRNQQSRLRLINAGDVTAHIRIAGRDDAGNVPRGVVRLRLAAGASHLLTAEALEQGSDDLSGRFGAGTGKWQLYVSARQPIKVMSLLRNPTGHLTNLSP